LSYSQQGLNAARDENHSHMSEVIGTCIAVCSNTSKFILFFFKPILQSYYLAENGKNSDKSYMELKLFADP